MEYTPIIKQLDTYARTLSLSNIRTQRHQQGLNITPLDAARYGARKDKFQCFLVLTMHFMILLFSVNHFVATRPLQIQRQQAFEYFFVWNFSGVIGPAVSSGNCRV